VLDSGQGVTTSYEETLGGAGGYTELCAGG
jgi:hypothetical protein